MAFTQKDLERQQEALAALQEEFSRLQAQEDALRKDLKLPDDGKPFDMASVPQELRAEVEKAMDEAARAGKARAAQHAPASASHSGGAMRRGAVRV